MIPASSPPLAQRHAFSPTPMNPLQEQRFDWPVCHEAEGFLLEAIAGFTARNRFARELEHRLRDETGTLLIDWVDFITLDGRATAKLHARGFQPDPLAETSPGQEAWFHPEAMLPRVILEHSHDTPEGHTDTIGIHVESIVDFMAAHEINTAIEGAPMSCYRRVLASQEDGSRFIVTERRGYRGFVVAQPDPEHAQRVLQAAELWRTRQRRFADDAQGFQETLVLLDKLIAMVGRDLACHVVFDGERKFWQRRNRAARIQKARQDALGMGWANHDHHTYRCSREHFVSLMTVMEKLGFQRRERFYAGDAAAWGAQILEQPIEGIVVFCDVDLLPEETEIDFSRQPLAPSTRLGTVGLWCGLHGESFLEAGMHHLECRFDHALLREQLKAQGIDTMKPFSDLPFLKQAFTEGEHWAVRPERAKKLLERGLITAEQCEGFIHDGAIGSHLENLQRHGGFKGFNQTSISAIIAATDPRLQ